MTHGPRRIRMVAAALMALAVLLLGPLSMASAQASHAAAPQAHGECCPDAAPADHPHQSLPPTPCILHMSTLPPAPLAEAPRAPSFDAVAFGPVDGERAEGTRPSAEPPPPKSPALV